jgi:hypothetical protein
LISPDAARRYLEGWGVRGEGMTDAGTFVQERIPSRRRREPSGGCAGVDSKWAADA